MKNTLNQVVLLVDMDGVLADYYGHFCNVFKKLHPEVQIIEPHDLSTFCIEDAYPLEYKKEIRRICCDTGFFETMPPVEGAVEAFKALLEDERFNVRICTAPELEFTNQNCFSEKARWIENHLGLAALERTIITKDKTLIYGNYLIDDKPEIKGSYTPYWTQIVFNHGYNKDLPREEFPFRLYGWKYFFYLGEELVELHRENLDYFMKKET